MAEQDLLVSRAARLGDTRLDWNEIDFVGWPEFRRMAPAVIGLEIDRLERLIAGADVGSDTYNTLVQARYALRKFVDGIDSAAKESAKARSEHLEQALLSLSAAHNGTDNPPETVRYIAHRLTYVHNRLRLIY